MIPDLPGLTFKDPRSYAQRRPQHLKIQYGYMVPRPVSVESVEKHIEEHSQKIRYLEPMLTSTGNIQMQQTFAENVLPTAMVPVGVLRFYAYFREEVTESNDETSRIRYVRIYAYLEDNTIMIEEQRQRNSGIDQGVLLKRMRALKPDAPQFGDQYVCADFNVGQNYEIYGITYHIYACDEFTERYFQEHGLELGEFEKAPDDIFTVKRKLTERPIRVSRVNADKQNLKRFLEYDGKVLRFYCTWDDTKSMFGEKRNFVLVYFLVDGSIEIRQVLPPNSGRDNVANFLKKSKLINPETKQPYHEQDFHIGLTVEVYNRKFFIYDADPFTRDYLDSKYGIHDWSSALVDDDDDEEAIEAEKNKNKRVIAEYNGWGDPEDSAGYCHSLHPKPPKKDTVKLLNNDGKVLRFSAQFKNPAPQDRDRKFVIAFFLADDTVAVFEKPQRNSGFKEGKFVQRCKLTNPATGKTFCASDFKIGAVLTINSFTFITTEADEYSLGFMEADADSFPASDLSNIISQLRQQRDVVDSLHEAFQAKDPELVGRVKPSDMAVIMESIGMPKHEIATVLRRWENKLGFDYFGFMSALQ